MAYDARRTRSSSPTRGNRRIVVFDADTGTYKRHWFAYGEKAAGARPVRTTRASRRPSRSATSTCVEIARDGMVYVCDKSSNRIQVFDKSGKFVKEGSSRRRTGGGIVAGSFGVAQRRGCGVGSWRCRTIRSSACCSSPTA